LRKNLANILAAYIYHFWSTYL